MSKKLLTDLQKLVSEGIITAEISDAIKDYYASNRKDSPNLMIIVFGVLGALLVGLGIILILAHNWDAFSRWQKTIIAFIPMVLGQVVCGYTLLKKNESIAWREAASTFLGFGVGACISLISQIYHIEGSMAGFMLLWTLLSLPIIYVMRSSMASLLYLVGITYYGCATSYFQPGSGSYLLYWLLLLLAIPYYYHLIRNQPKGNATLFHHVLIPLSVIICLGTVSKDVGQLMIPAYLLLLGVIYLLSQSAMFAGKKWMQNPYLILSTFGTLILLFILSFDSFWEELFENKADLLAPFFSNEMITLLILLFIYAALFFQKNKVKDYIRYVVPVSIIAFILGWFSPLIAIILVNLLILAIGIYFIREGSTQRRMDVMNIGLLTVAILIACRFFDIELSFVTRGILFVLLGIGFFVANYFLMKKTQKPA